jgi:hypothetical protein
MLTFENQGGLLSRSKRVGVAAHFQEAERAVRVR